MLRFDPSAVPPRLMRHLVRQARVFARHHRSIEVTRVDPCSVGTDTYGLPEFRGLAWLRSSREPSPVVERLIFILAERASARMDGGWHSLSRHEEKDFDPLAARDAADHCKGVRRAILVDGSAR